MYLCGESVHALYPCGESMRPVYSYGKAYIECILVGKCVSNVSLWGKRVSTVSLWGVCVQCILLGKRVHCIVVGIACPVYFCGESVKVSEQILNETSAQLGYTVPLMSVYTGKCRREDKSRTDTTKTKENPEKKQKKTKYSKTTLPWFSHFLWQSARKRGGLILQCSRADKGLSLWESVSTVSSHGKCMSNRESMCQLYAWLHWACDRPELGISVWSDWQWWQWWSSGQAVWSRWANPSLRQW